MLADALSLILPVRSQSGAQHFQAKDTKAEQTTRVGKQLLRGSKCGLCLQQADGRHQMSRASLGILDVNAG